MDIDREARILCRLANDDALGRAICRLTDNCNEGLAVTFVQRRHRIQRAAAIAVVDIHLCARESRRESSISLAAFGEER